ncbi:MAG: phytanoyl-CoA dioxygenase family protein [Alphaproteobacteria bacterium]|nr:phytanoyl-CoA dioxygenase family protein [Alphaproteobacteria bacterium]
MASELVSEYERQGFAFRPNLLSPAEVAVVIAELNRILTSYGDDPLRVIREKDGVTPRTVVNPHVYSDVFNRLVHHPALVRAAEELLGESVYVFQSGLNCKAAFNGDVWFWHQDYPAYHRDDHIPLPRMVNALIFFDDINTMNGPLMLVPGSQNLNDDMPENSDQGTSYSFRYTSPDVIKEQVRRLGVVAPTGPAGSVNFMNVNVLHGSAGNLSPWSRRMMTLTYNAMSNKATSPSVRPKHIVYDDRDLPAIVAMAPDCLTSLAS